MQRDDRIFVVVGGSVVLAVALIAGLEWLGSGITVEAPQRARVEVQKLPVSAPAISPAPAPAAVVEHQTSAGDRDRLVRAAAAGLSSHPELASWLVHDRLLRRFVSAVEAVAGGYSPRDEVGFVRPQRAFMVRENEGALVITSSTFRRYDMVADVLASLDTEGTVELYRKLGSQLEEVYAEVAWASSNFDSRFREAVDHLLELEVPSGPYEVEQRAIVYAFAEDELERLSDAQRQLLRMGPSNALRVQAKLRELRSAIGWPEQAPAVLTAELEATPPTTGPLLAEAIGGESSVDSRTETIAPVGAAIAP